MIKNKLYKINKIKTTIFLKMLPKFLSITNEKPVFFNLYFKRDNIGPYLSLKHPVADLQTVACRDAHNPQANRF